MQIKVTANTPQIPHMDKTWATDHWYMWAEGEIFVKITPRFWADLAGLVLTLKSSIGNIETWMQPCQIICGTAQHSSMSNNLLMFPALFLETLHNTHTPIYSHHSGVGSVHTDVQALYTRPGLCVIFRLPLRMLFYGCMETTLPLQIQIRMKGDIAWSLSYVSNRLAMTLSKEKQVFHPMYFY